MNFSFHLLHVLGFLTVVSILPETVRREGRELRL